MEYIILNSDGQRVSVDDLNAIIRQFYPQQYIGVNWFQFACEFFDQEGHSKLILLRDELRDNPMTPERAKHYFAVIALVAGGYQIIRVPNDAKLGKDLYLYSLKPFNGWTWRLVLHLEVKLSNKTQQMQVYTNHPTWLGAFNHLEETIEPKGFYIELDAKYTPKEDEAMGTLIDLVP